MKSEECHTHAIKIKERINEMSVWGVRRYDGKLLEIQALTSHTSQFLESTPGAPQK